MPDRRQFGKTSFHRDSRRILAADGSAGSGKGGPSHNWLGPTHIDTVTGNPVQNALVMGNATPQWEILLGPTTLGEVLIAGADPFTPAWSRVFPNDMSFDDNDGDSPVLSWITGSNDAFQMWAENDATPGDSDFVVKFPAADTDSQFIFRDSGDNDVAFVDADGNTTWDGAAHRFGVEDTQAATLTLSGHASGSEGGELQLEMSADHDSTDDHWTFDVYQTGVRLFPEATVSVQYSWSTAGRFQIDVASGDPIVVFDTDGADKFTVGVDDSDSDKFKINSGGSLADPSDFEMDSSGNVEIVGHVGIADGTAIATRVLNVADQIVENSGIYYGILGYLDAAPTGAFTTAYEGVEGYVEVTTAQTHSTNYIFGVTGRVEVSTGVAASLNGATAGGNFYVDAEDVTTAADVSGVQAWTPLVDTGLVVNGNGLWVRAGTVGAGSITNKRGIYIDAIAGGTTSNWALYSAGGDAHFEDILFINETSDIFVTQGVVFNQGTNDDHIVSWKSSSDVVHGMTDEAEADTWFFGQKVAGLSGGASLVGLTEATIALQLGGYGTTANTTKTTAGRAFIELRAAKDDGAGDIEAASVDDATANLVAIRDLDTTRFLFGADGSAHADVQWTTFDKHDDVALLAAVEQEFARRKEDPITAGFGRWALRNQALLRKLDLVHFGDGKEGMINLTKFQMVNTGAIRQLAGLADEIGEILLARGIDRELLEAGLG